MRRRHNRALAFSLLWLPLVQLSRAAPRGTAASAPPSIPGHDITSFDVDIDYIRFRKGWGEIDDDRPPRAARRKKKLLGHRRPIRLPRVRFDFDKLGEGVGNFFRFKKRRRRQGGTHIRRVADSFETVLNAHRRHGHGRSDDIDAPELLQACRSFLPVMKSFGPDAAAKDFAGNLKKADALRRSIEGAGKGKGKGKKHDKRKHSKVPQGRTLAEWLTTEVEAGIHKPGGILRDPSGAVGSLWMRRSIAYQHDLFAAVAAGTDPKTAAVEAYKSQLMPYHGYLMRRIYTAYMGAMMPASRRELLAQVGGYDEKELSKEDEEALMEDLKRLVTLWKPLLSQWKKTHEELDLEDFRRH